MNRVHFNRFGVLQRRGWVVVITVIVAMLGAYTYAHHKPPNYSASAYVLVSSGATRLGPGSANEASSLATTYSGLIPKDSAIIAAVSRQLSANPSDVRSAISVFTTNSTALLEVRYSATTPGTAIAGAKAVANAIVGPTPATKAIPAGAILLASLPTSASAASSTRKTALPLGGVMGIILGLIILLAWERFDPRIDSIDDLADVLEVPVTSDDFLSDERVLAIRHRWIELAASAMDTTEAGRGAPIDVALVGVGKKALMLTLRAAEKLQIHDESHAGVTGTQILVHPFGDPRSADGGQLMSKDPDLVVFVTRYGARTSDIIKAAQVLKAFGLKPDWGIISPKRSSLLRAGESAPPGGQAEDRDGCPPIPGPFQVRQSRNETSALESTTPVEGAGAIRSHLSEDEKGKVALSDRAGSPSAKSSSSASGSPDGGWRDRSGPRGSGPVSGKGDAAKEAAPPGEGGGDASRSERTNGPGGRRRASRQTPG